MEVVIIKYVLIILLLGALLYFLYLIREKDFQVVEEYYGIENNLLASLKVEETNKQVVKKILEEASKSVKQVELKHKQETEVYKEEKSLEIFKKNLERINIKSKIEEDNLKHILRIASAIIKEY
ncbi:hypothetical protein CLOACE_14360 [Clostridium acetireducens DSM 10703]|uniref:Uncharacterized protein n=1 Tax=Clostridium acetireducens DSM 10703 TaxID=1121290 RepID=A0A1E8EY73_9CLOT|nr:hypothetical protein [Clostridium acetireducens]OFI05891.1 hypothetical protein CLOACE_14360 [Clostridium acetireducens DSM 10703]